MASLRNHVALAYRTAFALGIAVFGSAFLAAVGTELLVRGRFPGLVQDPLAGAAQALARGDHGRAAREYRMAAALSPADHGLLMIAADGLMRAGDTDAALAALDQAERFRPADAPTLVARGMVLRAQGKTQAALRAFSQAVDRDPQDATALAGLGEVLLDLDRHADAIRYLTLSIDRQPKGSVHNSLGVAYALSGQPHRAIEHFERAAALDPGMDVSANLARARAAVAAAETRP